MRCEDGRRVRTILTVPGDNEHMVLGCRGRRADLIAFDLEDGVAEENKGRARMIVRAAIQPGDAVRINDPSTTREGYSDFDALYNTGATLILPKVGYPTIPPPPCPGGYIPVLESVPAVYRALEILETYPRTQLRAVIFGWADFCASALATPEQAKFLEAAAHQVVMAAKMLSLPCYLGPSLEIPNRTDSGMMGNLHEGWGFSCGFDGQIALHPDQLSMIEYLYTPAKNLAWAEKVDEFRFGPPFEKLADGLRESA